MEIHRVIGVTIDDEVCQNLANDGGEFESMTGKASGNVDSVLTSAHD